MLSLTGSISSKAVAWPGKLPIQAVQVSYATMHCVSCMSETRWVSWQIESGADAEKLMRV